MINKILPAIIIYAFLITNSPDVKAHGGRTDAYGCHNCRTGACAGEYHCHGGGGYVAPQVQVKPIETPSPQPIPPVTPKTQVQEYKTINNNIESINKSKEIQKQDEYKKSTSKPADSFVILASILGSLGLGYFIYNIFNKS